MEPVLFFSKYSLFAILNGVINNVPPSITLAQAALESGWGKYAAGNNFFGIKADTSWQGPVVYSLTTEEYDGNVITQTSGFRQYSSPYQSFKDHSRFLKENSRYDGLFSLPFGDYQGWAIGLSQAGYATASNYAPTVISLIEQYNLDRYDRAVKIIEVAGIVILLALAAWIAYKYRNEIKTLFK